MKKMKGLLLILTCAFIFTGCGNVELKNGENAIVSFKDDEGISSQELFEVLKEKYGSDVVINLIDTFLLEKEYDVSDEETSYIDQTVSSIESEATNNNVDFDQYIKAYYGASSNKELKDYIRLNYRRGLYIEDYAKTLVSDKQIETYYESTTIGDITASHILIMPDVKQDATDKEKEEADKKALAEAKNIIKKLNNKEDFAELAKKYSDDSASATNGGELGSFNRGEMDANFEAAAVALKVGTYSKTPVKSAYGYHIIYKTAQADKPLLDEAKEEIITSISKKIISGTPTIYYDGLKHLREKYEMKIEDSVLKDGYNTWMNSLKASSNSNTNQ